MKQKAGLKRCLYALTAAILLTVLAASSWILGLSNRVADELYQRPGMPNDNIVLVGIDSRSLEEFGPFPWDRAVLAEALGYLNADPENSPAVIGVDVIFSGNADPDSDRKLAQAASNGNVVVASSANFDSGLVTDENGGFFMNDYSVMAYNQPYGALKAVTDQGTINTMQDGDGILRHAIWQVDMPDGSKVPSFHRQIYTKYITSLGQKPTCVPPMDKHHRWYVPLSASPGAYDDGFSVVDLVAGDLDPAIFAGKIVLIGPYASGLQDSYPTAIDHADPMYGIEFQANSIAALLDGNVKQEAPRLPQLALLFLITFVAAFWFLERKVLPSTIVWLAGCVIWLAICLAAYHLGFVLEAFYIPLGLTACYVVAVALNYVHAVGERRRITRTFERYVAPEIVAELLKGDPKTLELGGRLTDIAVLFVDIRGFTTMSEGLDPPSVVDIINRYLTLTSQCVFQNSGTLDKYVGDCTMAFWGAPLPQEDCIYKAVKAGLDMVAGAEALGEELQRQYGRRVSFGVGIHFGPAVVGNIGSPTRMDYTAIGDTVNTASRLESNAPAGQILVSRAVADALVGRVSFTSLGDGIRLKGKAEGFEILRVDGLIASTQTTEGE